MNESLSIEQQDYKYILLVATQANYYKLEYPGYYKKLLEQIPLYPSNMFSAIQKDIPRTLLNQHPFQKSLRNILLAYAIRNPKLLYCQGMNYVVAYLLINNISQQDTFWIVVSLIQNILEDDFYKDLTTISITTKIFTDVFPYIFPQLAKEMKEVGMDCSLFVVSQYVCLFTKGFINSVSQYLMVKLILQSRNHSIGYILLKLSLGVIAAILGREEPFSFRRQFTAFRDKLQISVFQISLLQIKLGIQYIELNQTNYMKLQEFYRSKRQKHHISHVQNQLKTKKLTLPKCQLSYPICLQRIQIQRKVGTIQEVLVMKNGHSIIEQYIEDYFVLPTNKQSSCKIYQTFNDCLMYRQNHICVEQDGLQMVNKTHVDLESKFFNKRLQLSNDELFIREKEENDREISILSYENEISMSGNQRRYSKIDSKFLELSGFFLIDQKFKFSNDQEQVLEGEEQEEGSRNGRILEDSNQEVQQGKQNLNRQKGQNNLKIQKINHQLQDLSLITSNRSYQTPSHSPIGSQNYLEQPNQLQQQKSQQNLSQNINITYQNPAIVVQVQVQKTPTIQIIQQSQKQKIKSQQKQKQKTSISDYFTRIWSRVKKIKQEDLKN